MATQPKLRFTVEEYLARERLATEKSEYYAGEIYLMAGGTITHSRLALRMGAILDRLLPFCEVYDSNLKLFLEETQLCVYPDVMVRCGTPELNDGKRDVIRNPTLLVEVLSPSTEAYDKGTKAFYYRTIPSLQHCLLVSQDRPYIEHSVRHDDGTWLITQYTDRAMAISLKSLEIEISVSEVYRNII